MRLFILFFLFNFVNSKYIIKCMNCKYMIKNYKNMYTSKCRYYSIFNKTYNEILYDNSISFHEKNFISIQDALNDETKCGSNYKNYRPLFDYMKDND